MGLRDLSRGIRNAMFAERENIPEAYEYAMQVANACGTNKAGVITAVHVVLNTIAKAINNYAKDEEALVAAAEKAMQFADSVLVQGEGGDNFPFEELRKALADVKGEEVIAEAQKEPTIKGLIEEQKKGYSAREIMACLVSFIEECGADEQVEFYIKKATLVVAFQAEGGHFVLKTK